MTKLKLTVNETKTRVCKFPIAELDARDERVVRHGVSSQKRERFMLECQRKQQMWKQYVVTVGGF